MDLHSFDEKDLRSRLLMRRGKPLRRLYPAQNRNAAVLIPLLMKEGEVHILFEVRSRSIGQGGEICFPGGRIEPGEELLTAAVRETAEELEVDITTIEDVVPMHVMSGPGGAEVSSFAGWLNGYGGTWSQQEAERVFTLPLKYFAMKEPRIVSSAYRAELPPDFPYELIPGGREYPWKTIPKQFFFYETEEGVIWGLTAELLYRFLEMVCGQGSGAPGAGILT